MRNSVICFLITLVCLSCEVSVNQRSSTGHFELTRLIDDQVRKLGENTLKSEKLVAVNSKIDRLQQDMDSTALKEELAVFEGFDPGKSRFKNAFDIIVAPGITTYEKKSNEDQSLKWVKVEDKGGLLRITAEIIEETSIYTNQKRMDLRLESGMIKSYSLQGYQKMLFRDTTFFEMTTTIQN